MAEALGVAASAIAVIQISKEVISLCKFYIEALRSDAPTSLRAVLIEVSTLKSVLEGLEFISKCGTFTPALQNRLAASDGPIEGSRVAMTALEKLFPKQALQNGQNASKRQKVQAAFATLAWPLKQGQVQDLLQQISRHKDDIQLVLTTEATKDIKDIKAVSEEIRSILTDGTGSWMLRSQYWTDWLASSIRCLWVHGIPGSGKTILASWLIQNVLDHCKRVSTVSSPCTSAYYYCYFGHHQDEAAPFLRWIITQLSRRAEVVSTLMHDLFGRGGEPSISELLDALEQILQVFNCVYVVIDAVDESNPRDDLLDVIQALITDRRFPNLQILVTSREYIDIERVMEKVSVSVPMSNKLVEQDIRLNIQSILRSNTKFQSWPDDLLIEVEDAVSTQAKGMFRWAVCQLHELQRLKGDPQTFASHLKTLEADDSLRPEKQDLWKNLKFHSLFHVINSLRTWGQEISQSDDFYGRVKKLLCPSTQYLRCLGKLGFYEGVDRWVGLPNNMGLSAEKLVWTIDWNECLTDMDASLFLSLFLITNNMESPLLTRLIQEADLKAIFTNRIVLSKAGFIYTHNRSGEGHLIVETYEFDGPLVEMMVHFVGQDSRALQSLLVNHTGLYNPSMALLYFIGHCSSDVELQHIYKGTSFRLLQHLLKAGAQPNLPGYPLTPLQIAVAARNLQGVRLLLHFGADPNSIGDPLGSAWPPNSLIAAFERFHGMSPLRICGSGYCVSLAASFARDGNESALGVIQQLLLAYGGRDFQGNRVNH
ncbi:hypothetical protein FOC4_g10004055 [Fusarium odoratissimum]|uniref:NACHT domain-containing protein n=1 Tax=Fusarium oxysporum f. sp. cubense (strain race 4) TaxID=2502994 RepID=N1S3N5_FUSC4|nr:hypothetical protein FOC4_g10004055 [Fusarium odoratissimum]